MEVASEDTVATSIPQAVPGDHEPTVGSHGDRRELLEEAGIAVDLELDGERRAARVESPAEDAVAGSILAVDAAARPNHDESAVSVDRHCRLFLPLRV